MWGIGLKDVDLFWNFCQHSIINIAQKRNAILPSASSTPLSASKKGILFTIIATNAQCGKRQLDPHNGAVGKNRIYWTLFLASANQEKYIIFKL